MAQTPRQPPGAGEQHRHAVRHARFERRVGRRRRSPRRRRRGACDRRKRRLHFVAQVAIGARRAASAARRRHIAAQSPPGRRLGSARQHSRTAVAVSRIVSRRIALLATRAAEASPTRPSPAWRAGRSPARRSFASVVWPRLMIARITSPGWTLPRTAPLTSSTSDAALDLELLLLLVGQVGQHEPHPVGLGLSFGAGAAAARLRRRDLSSCSSATVTANSFVAPLRQTVSATFVPGLHRR